LIVFQHDYDENNVNIAWDILEGKAIEKIEKTDEMVSGILEWGKAIKFRAFVVPIDVFSQYDDQIVLDEIISKLG